MYIVKSHKYKCMYMYMDNGSTCTSLLGSHHNVVIPVKHLRLSWKEYRYEGILCFKLVILLYYVLFW